MSAVPQDAEMMFRAVSQAFVNQIHTIVNYIGNFEVHTLNLLGDADYKQRKRAVGVCTNVFMNSQYRRLRLEWARYKCMEYYDECFEKVKDGFTVDEETGEKKQKWKKVCTDPVEAAIWNTMVLKVLQLESKNDAVIEMAKSALALFRRLGITEAFEAYEETVADILGVEKRGATKARKAAAAAKEKKSFKERLAEKMDRSKADGVLPKETPIAE